MLDENLPTFYIKPSSDNPLSSTVLLGQNGDELQPEYTLRRPDPKLPVSKNCYAVALYDSYNPEVLFAEVLVQPDWTQPTLSQAEIRAQNGIPQPPVPVVPNQFAIQLYNPDQQVTVKQIPGTWNSSAHWEFEMPQTSFRLPSASALDRSQNDPTASEITPKVAFKWKRDGKLSKDISCYLSGKSTDGRKTKEPDITVAMFKSDKNLTLYQPNWNRIDVEDLKGLEVVLILGATVIKDIFFNANREMFNISSPQLSKPGRKNSGPVHTGRPGPSLPLMSGGVVHQAPVPSSQIPPQQYSNARPQQHQTTSRPPPANPRQQWEIDAETERLKRVVEQEAKDCEKRDRDEQKRIKKMLEAEEKEAKRRDAEVAKETERLRKQYGVTNGPPSGPPRVQFTAAPTMPPRPQHQQQSHSNPQQRPGAFPQFHSAPHSRPVPVQRPVSSPSTAGAFNLSSLNNLLNGSHQQKLPKQSGPYLQTPGHGNASSSGFFGLGGSGGKKVQKKRSVYF